MNSIKVENNTIDYNCGFHGNHNDQSWSLGLNEIVIIGGVNRMNGDDDSDFLVLINKTGKKHFLNLTKEVTGLSNFIEEFELKFEVKYKDWSKDFYDKDKIIYPPYLLGRKLYKKSWKKKLRTVLAIDHVADGELTNQILKYITNNS